MEKLFRKARGRSDQVGIGGRGEDEATVYLRDLGYEVIEQNWSNTKGKRVGEIDILARRECEYIFVEVKSRMVDPGMAKNTRPQDQITPTKLRKVARAAELYISRNSLWDAVWRIDAITVIYEGEKTHIKHIKSIYY